MRSHFRARRSTRIRCRQRRCAEPWDFPPVSADSPWEKLQRISTFWLANCSHRFRTDQDQSDQVADQVKIAFLGGLGEIGRNCACFELNGRIVVLDVGVMFPDPDMPGVDLVLPDFTYLQENADRVDAVILTHGHEDHTGGLAYLLRSFPVPVYGSELTLALARNRVDEAGMTDRAEFIPVIDGERRKIGPCEVEFIPVTHSVPHSFATAF